MKKIVTFFFVIGLTFGGYGFFYSFSMLIALNGIGNFFEVKDAEKFVTKIEEKSNDLNIYYTYEVGGKVYSNDYKTTIDYFQKCGIDTIVVKYNAMFPMVSYIDGIPLKTGNQKSGMFLSGIFLLFIIVLWRYGKMD